MIKPIFKSILPKRASGFIKQLRHSRVKANKNYLKALTEDNINNILIDRLGLQKGDVVFVHSSIEKLKLDFPFYGILKCLQSIVGKKGTILFPTYPKLRSQAYLSTGETFDVRNTPSYTGVLNEFARRQKNAIRSIHPTKSVCAIGEDAYELTNTHQRSPYPFDKCSPYYKVVQYGGKIIGIGVSTQNLSLVHTVEDTLGDEFPVSVYHRRLFHARCINYKGEIEIVQTYAHKRRMMNHKIPAYIKTNVVDGICEDLEIEGASFFRANASGLFDVMYDLAKRNITIYPRIIHRWKGSI